MVHRYERTYTYAERIYQDDDFPPSSLFILSESVNSTLEAMCKAVHRFLPLRNLFRILLPIGQQEEKLSDALRSLLIMYIHVCIQYICIPAQRTELLILFADKVETLLKKYLLMFYLYLFIYFFLGENFHFSNWCQVMIVSSSCNFFFFSLTFLLFFIIFRFFPSFIFKVMFQIN